MFLLQGRRGGGGELSGMECCLRAFAYVCVYVCACVGNHAVCMYYFCLCICVGMHVCMRVRGYVCTCVCMYFYMQIYIHVYMHICEHTYAYVPVSQSASL